MSAEKLSRTERFICEIREVTSTGGATQGAALDRVRRTAERFARRQIARDIPKDDADEIAARVACSAIAMILEGRGAELASGACWTIIRHDVIDAVREWRRASAAYQRYAEDRTHFYAELERTHPEGAFNVAIDLWRSIERMPWKIRNALVLHDHLGYEISSQDDPTHTVTNLLACSDKTARRWIKRAEKSIADGGRNPRE